MGIVIGNNIASRQATRRLDEASSMLDRALTRLSTGRRINSAADDAAGLSISSMLRSGARVYGQAVRNGNDAFSALNIAQGSLEELSSVVTRLKELAEQSANGTISRIQRLALDQEAHALTKEFNRVVGTTKFNDLSLLDPALGTVFAQLGYGTGGMIGVDISGGLRREIGSGQFGAAQTWGGNASTGAVVADFNGDGKLDIASVASILPSFQVGLGNGDGTFQTPTTTAAASNGRSIAAGDFNGDGKIDLVVGGSASLQIFTNDGNGSFSSTFSASPGATTNVAVADTDGDGKSDIIASVGSNILVYRGDGAGSASLANTIANGSTVASLGIGDFNADGKIDFATTSSANSNVRVYTGDGSNQFTQSATLTVGAASGKVGIGDINRDGLADIVSSNGDVLLSQGNGSNFTTGTSLTFAASGPLSITDINGDGYMDVVRTGVNFLETFAGNGDGTFGSAIQTSRAVTTSNVLGIGDFNGDGVSDVLTGSNEVRFSTHSSATTIEHMNLATREGALAALTSLDTYLQRISSGLGNIGSSMSRLETALANLHTTKENYTAAASRIEDADVASESAELTRANILKQTAASVLSQASLQPRIVLQLLGT